MDEDVGEDAVVSACLVFVLFLVLCNLFRGLRSWVILALQVNDGVHLGVDNLARPLLFLLSWLRMENLFCLLRGCSVSGDWIRLASLR